MTINFKELQNVYNNQMNLLLASNGLTTRCLLNFGVTRKEICPNCVFDPNLKKSANKYKTGGPQPFIDGRMCPYCNGAGYRGLINVEAAYLAVIWDYKYWINKPANFQNPTGMIQTICNKEYFNKIKQCQDMTVMLSETNANPLFKLVEEPNPVGLGDNNYIFCNWEKVGTSSITESMLPRPIIGLNIVNYNNGGLLLPVGTVGGPSAYGTYDQGGNAGEMTSTYATSTTIVAFSDNASSSLSQIYKGGKGTLSYAGDPMYGFRTCYRDSVFDKVSSSGLNLTNYVLVGDKNNPRDTETSVGAVTYDYHIDKYETTISGWCEFINSVASYATTSGMPVDSDTYGILNAPTLSGITYTAPTGFPGYYTFTPSSGNENKPITGMSWLSAARYCNWLSNLKPSGYQTVGNSGIVPNVATTERGTYTLDGIIAMSGNTSVFIPSPTGLIRIPTADEWYKAGFYKSSRRIVSDCGGTVSANPTLGTKSVYDVYWNYATQYDTPPGTP